MNKRIHKFVASILLCCLLVSNSLLPLSVAHAQSTGALTLTASAQCVGTEARAFLFWTDSTSDTYVHIAHAVSGTPVYNPSDGIAFGPPWDASMGFDGDHTVFQIQSTTTSEVSNIVDLVRPDCSAIPTATPTPVFPVVSFLPTQACPGANVTASVTNLNSSSTVRLSWDVDTNVLVTSTGMGSFIFTVPTNASAGTHHVSLSVTNPDAGIGTSYIVNDCSAPTYQLSTNQGMVGSAVTVTTTGGGGNINTLVYWGSGTQPIASNTGSGSFTFTVPNVAAGNYTVTIQDTNSGASSNFSFTVTAATTVTPLSGPPGQQLHITGTNANIPNGNVQIYWSPLPVTSTSFRLICSPAADSTGHFDTLCASIPSDAIGGTAIDVKVQYVTSANSGIGSTDFTFNVTVPISPTLSPVPCATPNSQQVAVYRDINFQGPCDLLTIGDWIFQGQGSVSNIPNDQLRIDEVSSIQIGSGVTVTVKDYFQGEKTFNITGANTNIADLTPYTNTTTNLTVNDAINEIVISTPTAITFNFTKVYLDGLGNAGDNTNPFPSVTPTPPFNASTPRPMIVQLFNSQVDTLPVVSLPGSLTYNPAGYFSGSASWDTSAATQPRSGSYYIKIKTAPYLVKSVLNLQTATLGSSVTIPQLSLVTGDIDQNNALNIDDYAAILSCGDFQAVPLPISDPNSNIHSSACQAIAQQGINVANAELTADGVIDDNDINQLLRELAVQNGQ